MYFDRKHWSAVVAEKSKLCVYQHSTFKRKDLIKKGTTIKPGERL